MMNPRRSPRHRRALAASVLLFIALGLVIAIVKQDAIEELFVEPAPAGTPRPAAPATTAEERAIYDYVAPRLAALTAEAELLEQMGRERSRNLAQLQVRSDRVSQLADEIDSFLVSNPVPARLQPATDRYLAAVAEVRDGMQASRAAVFRFDWDAVEAGLDVFSRGTNELEAVSAMFQELVSGDATPPTASMDRGRFAA